MQQVACCYIMTLTQLRALIGANGDNGILRFAEQLMTRETRPLYRQIKIDTT
jgi:hypothetical protein